MYLLPAIDILDGKAVRLAKGDYSRVTRYNDDPVEQALRFERAGAAWIHIVDLDGARTGVSSNVAIIERIVASTSLKAQVGGGVRSLEVIERLISAGASRVVLGTALVRDPGFAAAAVDRYGDALAAGIDAKGGEAAVSGWEEGSGVLAHDLARSMADLGYRHLVYTDISRDGMRTGLDPEAYRSMAGAFGNPVVASGGVAGLDDIRAMLGLGDAIEGVIAGRALYEGSLDLAEACREIAQYGKER